MGSHTLFRKFAHEWKICESRPSCETDGKNPSLDKIYRVYTQAHLPRLSKYVIRGTESREQQAQSELTESREHKAQSKLLTTVDKNPTISETCIYMCCIFCLYMKKNKKFKKIILKILIFRYINNVYALLY